MIIRWVNQINNIYMRTIINRNSVRMENQGFNRKNNNKNRSQE